jgi:sortase A
LIGNAMKSGLLFRSIERGLFVVGLVLLALWTKDEREAYAFQSVASRHLDQRLESGARTLAAEPGSTAREPSLDAEMVSSLGRIEIPRLRISAMIAEGTEPWVLARAVGHVASTARPGEPGNVALAGHRDTFFQGLGEISVHDLIRIVTSDTTFTYRVEWTAVVEPRRVDLLDSTSTPSLTLVTCYPFQYVGAAPRRFVVRARRAEAPAL